MAREIYKTVPLDNQLIPEVLRGSNFTNETSAHQFIITCTKNNEPVRLTGSVRGRFIAADNTSFLIDGSIVSGNAVVTLHQDCYHAPGRFQFVIFNTNGTENVAIYAAVGEVRRSDTNELYITGEPLPDIDELLDAMGDLRDIIQDYDDIVLVQSEQPTSATNKIWIQPQADEYQVPTMQEHEDLVDEVADLKSAFNNTNVIISGGTYSAKVGEITEGGRIGPTGVYAANAQWCYGYVDVHLFKSITVSQIGISDTTIINTCDSNKTHRRNLKTWAAAGTYNYTLEDGDYYLCISAQIVDMPIVVITSNFDGIIKDINDNADDIEEMNQRYNADMGLPILTINTTTSAAWSKKIVATFDLKQGYKYRFTITGESTNSRYLALCNSGGTSLASYNKTTDGYFDYVPESNLTNCYLDYRSSVSGADAVVSYLIVSPTIMSRLETVEGAKQIVISGNVFAVVGDKLQIFYKSFIEGLTDTDIVKFSCDIGKNYPRYWEVTPVAGNVGNHTITINIYDSNGGITTSKTCILKVVSASNPGSMKNVLCIGDSTMANGQIPIEASRRIKGTSGTATSPAPLSLSNISFTGRKENADHTVGWEGTGGWTFVNYMQAGVDAVRFTVTGATDINIDDVYSINSFRLRIAEINVTSGNGNIRCTFDYKPSGSSWDATAQTGTLTKYSGNGQQTIAFTAWVSESFQPFWNNNTNTFDIETYVDTYCGGHADVICILLGINSVISRDPFASMEDLVNNYAKVFAGMIHEQLPSSKIIMSTLPPASPNGGIGSNYGSGANSGAFNSAGFAHKIFEYNKLLLGLNADSSVNSYLTVINTHAQFDPEYGYPSENVPVNGRQTETIQMQTNAVHPNDGGYWQLSDAMAFRTVLAMI